jgi:uncharacterized RDD family membrane protein YckC
MTPTGQPIINPYAPPEAPIETPYAYDDVLVLADRGTRLGAYLLDYAWIFVLAMLLAIAAPLMDTTRDNSSLATAAFIFIAVAAVGVVAWNMVLIHRYGQTMGKRWLNIKIVRCSGERCSLRRYIFLRWLPVGILANIPLLGIIIGLGNPLMIFREDRRCGHDFIADTIVVNV